MKKIREFWKKSVDIVTVIWLISFILSYFVSGILKSLTNTISIFVAVFFIIDLIIIFREIGSIKIFLKQNWLDILLLIPFFRLFKVLRFAKVKRIGKIYKLINKSKRIKKTPEMIDLLSKTNERIRNKLSKIND